MWMEAAANEAALSPRPESKEALATGFASASYFCGLEGGFEDKYNIKHIFLTKFDMLCYNENMDLGKGYFPPHPAKGWSPFPSI